MRNQGFTIVEFVVVIAVVLILAAAAIGGTSAITRSLRFTNTFNKLVFMVQQARNLAITGKNPDVKEYAVQFNFASAVDQPQTIKLFHDTNGDHIANLGAGIVVAETIIEEYRILASTNLALNLFNISSVSTACATSLLVSFENGTGKTNLFCGGVAPEKKASNLRIGITDATTSNVKYFLIHEAAGIPQVL